MPDLKKLLALLVAVALLCAACRGRDDTATARRGDGSDTLVIRPEDVPPAERQDTSSTQNPPAQPHREQAR